MVLTPDLILSVKVQVPEGFVIQANKTSLVTLSRLLQFHLKGHREGLTETVDFEL